MTHTETKTIERLDRMRSSVNGNPRFSVTFTDGTTANTQVDAMVAYGIENPEYRGGPVEVTFTRKGGNITYVKPREDA